MSASHVAESTRRRLGMSVATKIFLGFAAVIIAFGTASAFTLYRMSTLRQTVTVLWKELTPMSNQLRGLSRQLKSAEEFLALKRANDAQWLQQVLPALEPFTGPHGFRTLADRLATIADSDTLTEESRAELANIAKTFREFASGPALAEVLSGEELTEVIKANEKVGSEELYERLVRRTLKVGSLGELSATSPETRATARVLRRLNREVNDAVRALAGPIRSIDLRTEQDERNSRLVSVIIAGLALLVSVGMLAMALVTLRPIRKLRAGAQRIAAGDYAERVDVGSADEIGQLAAEFNRMADSLQQRDLALADKQRELVEAERLAAVGRLAAQITHEVRNPLSSIGLNAELLEEEIDELAEDPARGSEAKKMLTSIAAEVQRLKEITEQYLQLTRFSRGQRADPPADQSDDGELEHPVVAAALKRQPTDLVTLVTRFVEFLGPEAQASEVQLEVLVDDPRPPTINADGDQLRQALLNLSKNSLDALKQRHVDRKLSLRVTSHRPGWVGLVVEDNGPGFPDSMKDTLFKPFVTDKPHGTGLGLAVTRDIVLAHGGEIAVEDVGAQGGARVRILLPAG